MTEEAPERAEPVTMVATWTDPAAVELLEAALPHTTHLKPLWERIRVLVEDQRALVGLPISAKVTDETCDNHARHFWSLLNLLGVPIVPSPMALKRLEVDGEGLRPLFYIDPKEEKEKEKARLKAEAAAAAAEVAEAAEAAEGAEGAEVTETAETAEVVAE